MFVCILIQLLKYLLRFEFLVQVGLDKYVYRFIVKLPITEGMLDPILYNSIDAMTVFKATWPYS